MWTKELNVLILTGECCTLRTQSSRTVLTWARPGLGCAAQISWPQDNPSQPTVTVGLQAAPPPYCWLCYLSGLDFVLKCSKKFSCQHPLQMELFPFKKIKLSILNDQKGGASATDSMPWEEIKPGSIQCCVNVECSEVWKDVRFTCSFYVSSCSY